MKLKTILCGAVAAQLIFAGSVAAGDRTGSETQQLVAAELAYMQLRQPQNKMRQPGPRNPDQAYVQLAQAALDPKVLELEEQIRQLNGQLEELNFQVLQMQDQMRKMQEDNEFRFQQLEGGGPAAGKKTEAAPAAAGATERAQAAGDGASIETIIAQPDGTNALPPQQGGSADLGAPPRDLGRITFDAKGNPVQTGAGALPGVETGREAPDGTAVAALPPTDNPDELYRNSYEMVLSGDYAMAEAGFRDHIARFPKDARAADAHFWLGESLLGQERYREAAQVFLEANRDYPDAKKAPDAMLKLGMSLAAMNQRDVACATLAEVSKRYPKASPAILQRAKEERARASC